MILQKCILTGIYHAQADATPKTWLKIVIVATNILTNWQIKNVILKPWIISFRIWLNVVLRVWGTYCQVPLGKLMWRRQSLAYASASERLSIERLSIYLEAVQLKSTVLFFNYFFPLIFFF